MSKVKVNEQQPHRVTITARNQIKIVKQADTVKIVR